MGVRLTGLSAEELENFFLLQPRIFSDYRDPRRGPFEMLYLYGETTDNDQSHLFRAIELAESGAMNSIGISGADAANGYAGFDESVRRLKDFGWKSAMPISIARTTAQTSQSSCDAVQNTADTFYRTCDRTNCMAKIFP